MPIRHLGKLSFEFTIFLSKLSRQTMKSAELLQIVLSKLRTGDMPAKIFRDLVGAVSLKTIKRWKAKFLQHGTVLRSKPGPQRLARCQRNRTKIDALRRKKLSTRKIGRKVGVSHTTVHRVLREDMQLKAYKRRKAPKLTETHIRKRKGFANWVRHNFHKEDAKNILFSDEKLFDLDGVYNRQNDRIWAATRAEADSNGGVYRRNKFPKKVMVWLGVCSKGVTNVVILQGSVNHQSYLKNVLPVARRCGNKLLGGNWTFQQDGATAHTHELSQKYCRDNLPNFISKDRWPPNSPDLNPLDYCIWNEIVTSMRWDKAVCKTTLITEIKRAVRMLRPQVLLDSCSSWYSRVRKVGANGGIYLG